MAEIKSTLEMVMARAARMSAEATGTPENSETERKGMRLAAAFLNGDKKDLRQSLQDQPPGEQIPFRNGMVRTLLRNIVLPRDGDISDSSRLSLKAIQELGGNSSEIVEICTELNQILEQYSQHKEQVRQQLDEAIRGQLKQKLQQQGQSLDDDVPLNPATHPQYQEEWARVVSDLNDQYNQALDQRREQIKQRLGA